MRVLIVSGLLLLATSSSAVAQSDKYDPTTDPNVRAYYVCIQLASGGGDNSAVPPAEAFDDVGYITWSDGLTKAFLCQEVDKGPTDAG